MPDSVSGARPAIKTLRVTNDGVIAFLHEAFSTNRPQMTLGENSSGSFRVTVEGIRRLAGTAA